MSRSPILGGAFVLLVMAVLTASPASAHEFPESVMNAFVKVEPDRLHLVLRVPLELFGPDSSMSVSFPANAQRELELDQAGPVLERALATMAQEIPIRAGNAPLIRVAAAGRLSRPSDRSFETYDEAVAHIARPVALGTVIYAGQGFLDAYLTYRMISPASDLTLQTRMSPEFREKLQLVVRFMPLEGPTRIYRITSRDGRVALDLRWYQAVRVFVKAGLFQILGSLDPLLFLLCLVIPFRRFRDVLPILTAFMVAHSITLLASAYGGVPAGPWFPPLIETLIAASIVYLAMENIVAMIADMTLDRRWLMAGGWGLVHGWGFAYSLQEGLQFAGSHLSLSLVSFNLGIALGQVLVLLVALPGLGLLARNPLIARIGGVILSALLAHTGWHWMLDRAAPLQDLPWPILDAALVVTLARWALLWLLIGGIVWCIMRPWRRYHPAQNGQHARMRATRDE